MHFRNDCLTGSGLCFRGILEGSAGIAQKVFYITTGICVLSSLLSLFEGEPEGLQTGVLRVHDEAEAAQKT